MALLEDKGPEDRLLPPSSRPVDHGDPDPGPVLLSANKVALPLSVVGLVVGWLALGWAPARGWITLAGSLAGPLAGLAVVGARTAGGSPVRRRRGLGAMAAEGLLLAAVVGGLLHASLPTAVEMRAALGDVQLPSVGPYRSAGTRLCKGGCQSVTRTYRVPPGTADTETFVHARLIHKGWRPMGGKDAYHAYGVRRGRLQAEVVGAGPPDEVEVTVAIVSSVRPVAVVAPRAASGGMLGAGARTRRTPSAGS